MSTLSGCTLVRNAVKLKYPLEASIQTYYPICDEVVIAYDPKSEDETEAFVLDLARRYPKLRPVPSPWDLENHKDGTEITIQSNVAADACTGEWVLYVQADEAIHEGDHAALREALHRDDINGVLFDRRSFLGSLDREIPEYFARNLLRVYRNGLGCVVGDGMTCGLVPTAKASVLQARLRMYNYSRMGEREEILLRSRCRDNFHIGSKEGIEENLKHEFTQSTRPFDPAAHPEPIRRLYGASVARPVTDVRPSYPVAIALLVGPGERENLAPFFWQFRGWPGEFVIFDDATEDGGGDAAIHCLREILKLEDGRFRITRATLGGDFGLARNRLQELARSPWVLTTAPDERWDPGFLRHLDSLVTKMEHEGKIICGFPRANFVDGVLVNDIPDSEWTEEGLFAHVKAMRWPPMNLDFQYRLLEKQERWKGRIHEQPERLSTRPESVVILRDHWILHNKSISRQRKQDSFYKSLGQKRGMPDVARPDECAPTNLREATLQEVMERLPGRALVVVETGTLRDPSPEARASDGWSTYWLAALLARRGIAGSRLHSIDINPAYIEVSKRTLPPEFHPWVEWRCADATQAIKDLPVSRIDLLYLDSSDDPRQILAEFEAALSKLSEESIVVVDDTGPYHAGPDGKGTLVLPNARQQGWSIERRDDARCHMSILSRGTA